MAHPFVGEDGFETGAAQYLSDAEVDGNGVVAVRHYSFLAANRGEVPYRGAYCGEVNLAGADTNNNFNIAQAISANTVRWVRFYFYAENLAMTADDAFAIFAMHETGGAEEAIVYLRNAAGTIMIGAAENQAAGDGGVTSVETTLTQGKWIAVEMRVDIDAGGGDDGTIDFYIDGRQVGARLSGLDQNAITHLRLGANGVDAGTTAGVLLFDQFVIDDARVFPFRERYPQQMMLTQTGHTYLGNGRVGSVTLLSGSGVDSVVTLYDTDEANTADASNVITVVGSGVATSTVQQHLSNEFSAGYFSRGCYVSLAGTAPRAIVTFAEARMSNSLAKQQGLLAKPSVV